MLITHLGLQATSLDQLLINTLSCRRSKLPQKNKTYVIPIDTLPDRRGPCPRPPPGPPPSAQDARGCVGAAAAPGGVGGGGRSRSTACASKRPWQKVGSFGPFGRCVINTSGGWTQAHAWVLQDPEPVRQLPHPKHREVRGLKYEILFSLLLPR